MFLWHSKNLRTKHNAFLGVEGKKNPNKKQHKNNVSVALHLKYLRNRRLRIQVGRKHWHMETHITLLGPNVLKMGLDKPGGQPRRGQEIPAGDEAEQGRLTRLEIWFFPRRWH